jgi:serine/threonine protein kinase
MLKTETALNFEREANLLRQLNFPHIVRYLGLWQNKDQQYFIVMEYLKLGTKIGWLNFICSCFMFETFFILGSLDSLLAIHADELNTKVLIGMARDVAAGLLYLSQNNIVHR